MSTAALRPLAPVNLSQVLSVAALFNLARHTNRESWMNASNISHEAEELFTLLEARGVFYLLVGGLAMLTHAQGRNTEDVDLIISVPDQRRLLPEVELVDPPEKGSPFALGHYKGLRVDYLDARAPLFKLVLEKHSERRPFIFASGAARELPVASPEGLMLLKLFALPNVTQQMDWKRVRDYEADIVTLWMMDPVLDPRGLLPTLRRFLRDEWALHSLEHEVLPDLAKRRARYLGQGTRPPPPQTPPGGDAAI